MFLNVECILRKTNDDFFLNLKVVNAQDIYGYSTATQSKFRNYCE